MSFYYELDGTGAAIGRVRHQDARHNIYLDDDAPKAKAFRLLRVRENKKTELAAQAREEHFKASTWQAKLNTAQSAVDSASSKTAVEAVKL